MSDELELLFRPHEAGQGRESSEMPTVSRRTGAFARATPVILHKKMTVAEGFSAIVGACVCHYLLNAPLVIEQRGEEALHQARVAMRRLRSAFALFRPTTADEESAHIEGELRWFSRLLGDARNLDVYLQGNRGPPALEESRQRAYDDVIVAMDSRRVRRLMTDVVVWSAAGEWRSNDRAEKPLGPFADRGIDKLWKKLRAAGTLAELDEQQRHHVRIKAKKLRYALEFTQALHRDRPRRRRKFGKAIGELQDALGRLNDIRFARALAGDWVPPIPVEDEAMHLDAAERALRRLRKVGCYWN